MLDGTCSESGQNDRWLLVIVDVAELHRSISGAYCRASPVGETRQRCYFRLQPHRCLDGNLLSVAPAPEDQLSVFSSGDQALAALLAGRKRARQNRADMPAYPKAAGRKVPELESLVLRP